MGPGYFPAILSWLMVALGAVIAGLAWRAPHQDGCLRRGAVAGAGADRRRHAVLRRWPCAGWAWGRCWWWWCSPPPGPAAMPACKASTALALGIALFCSGLFIKGLGLPLPLTGPWLSAALLVAGAAPPPAPAAAPPPPPRPSKGARPWSCSTIWAWASPPRCQPVEPALRLRRLPAGHRRRRAAGPGAARDHRHALAADLLAAAGLGPDHALGHLLRRPVWRLDHRDPDQPAGREPPRW